MSNVGSIERTFVYFTRLRHGQPERDLGDCRQDTADGYGESWVADPGRCSISHSNHARLRYSPDQSSLQEGEL